MYREAQNGVQNIAKKDPGRVRQISLATAETNFTKPGAHQCFSVMKISMYQKSMMDFK